MHLGGVLDHRGTMEPEARRRLAIASTAYDAGRDLISRVTPSLSYQGPLCTS